MYVNNRSSKKVNKKPGWKQREVEHKAWLLSHGVNPDAPKKRVQSTAPKVSLEAKSYVRQTQYIPSLNSKDICGVAPKKESQKYTGTLIKGIATMHKSNAIPIISQEQAIEVATMRRS